MLIQPIHVTAAPCRTNSKEIEMNENHSITEAVLAAQRAHNLVGRQWALIAHDGQWHFDLPTACGLDLPDMPAPTAFDTTEGICSTCKVAADAIGTTPMTERVAAANRTIVEAEELFRTTGQSVRG